VFISIKQLKISLRNLEAIHPFFVITFLVCKKGNLPIGYTVEYAINAEESKFLAEYFYPYKESNYFYRIFRTSGKNKHWTHKKKYASSTLQSIRTKTVFASSFIHDSNSSQWGWKDGYVDILKANLSQNLSPYENKAVPVFDLACWFYREREWSSDITASQIIQTFLDDFFITQEEIDAIFDTSSPAASDLFQDNGITEAELLSVISSTPPDVDFEEDGTLEYLEMQGIGPAKHLVFEPASRLNLVTGDNGLGKTFLLECAWWALTGQWADLPAYPRQDATRSEPKITFQIAGEIRKMKIAISYDWDAFGVDKWPVPAKRPTIPGLLIYARVDGSFAICDPLGNMHQVSSSKAEMPRSFVFSRDQVWNGFEETINGQKRSRINGLIRDWVSWQNDPNQEIFKVFTKVLKRLSPPSLGDLGTLDIGSPVRLTDDARQIPTLKHSYGTIPILHASAGVKRIITLAYLIVWAWNEHLINSKASRKKPQSRIVILIDELESHLHPQWQRRILPALLEVKNDLVEEFDIEVQSIIATHSPLVLASAEPIFNTATDKLFHLDVPNDPLFASEVKLETLPFISQGLVNAWLTSEVFDLAQARSLEAEEAIERAKILQQQENPALEELESVTNALRKTLSDIDVFWPRWLPFAVEHGVKI
jgi:hypothetical protein